MPTTAGQHDFLFEVISDSVDATPINNETTVTVFVTDTLLMHLVQVIN